MRISYHLFQTNQLGLWATKPWDWRIQSPSALANELMIRHSVIVHYLKQNKAQASILSVLLFCTCRYPPAAVNFTEAGSDLGGGGSHWCDL